jgi:hypothetical protein
VDDSKSVGATLVDRLAKVEVKDCVVSGVSIRDKKNMKWRPATAADLLNAKVGEQIAVATSNDSNDPDGVGEGWRRVLEHEPIVVGDESRCVKHVAGQKNDWITVVEVFSQDHMYGREYRRRIETPKQET